MNYCAAALAPHPRSGFKSTRERAHCFVLLLGRQSHHTPARIRIAECRKDPAADSKVGMRMMGILRCVGEAECEMAKLIRSHERRLTSLMEYRNGIGNKGAGGRHHD